MADDGLRIVGSVEAHADEATRKRLAELKGGEAVELVVDGMRGIWRPEDASLAPVFPPGGETATVRNEALERLLRAARESTARSDGPYGPREELYDR